MVPSLMDALMHKASRRKAGRQPLRFLYFEGALNRLVVEEKFYYVLPNRQLWSQNPDCRKMNFVFLKDGCLFWTFDDRLTFGIGK